MNILYTRAKRLIDHALLSTHPRAKVAAMIFSNRRVISVGINLPNSGTSQIPAKYRKWPSGICAEMDAILRARMDVRGMDILVVRVNKAGNELRLAKPCAYCQAYLRHVGINNIYYSTSSGTILKFGEEQC